MNGVADMFNDPNLLSKLGASPKTRPYLSQPDFLEKLKQIQQNPNALGRYVVHFSKKKKKRKKKEKKIFLNTTLSEY